MKTAKTESTIGIMTDEAAMAELLEKFLTKEGFKVGHVPYGKITTDGLSMMVLAPTRELSKSGNLFEDLKSRIPTLLVLQYNENEMKSDENSVVLAEHPINLRKLGESVTSILKRSTNKNAASGIKVKHDAVR